MELVLTLTAILLGNIVIPQLFMMMHLLEVGYGSIGCLIKRILVEVVPTGGVFVSAGTPNDREVPAIKRGDVLIAADIGHFDFFRWFSVVPSLWRNV